MFRVRPAVVILLGATLILGSIVLTSRWKSARAKSRIGVSVNGRLEKSDAEWHQLLSADQYRVTRQKGTERAFSGANWNTKKDGVYECVCCGQPLFDSKAKFASGSGWPSFWEPIDENNVSLTADDSLWMRRTGVTCSRCDAHLGHLFEDGPPPTGLRYCMNSVALKLVKRDAIATPTVERTAEKTGR